MQFVNDRVEAEVCAMFWNRKIPPRGRNRGVAGDTKFVEVKKRTHYGSNMASTCQFDMIYVAMC